MQKKKKICPLFDDTYTEVDKVTLKSNGDEAFKNGSLLKSNSNEALNKDFFLKVTLSKKS